MAESSAPRLGNHPRRPPAHKSVSLRHSTSPVPEVPSSGTRSKHRSRVPSSNLANPPSSNGSKPDTRKESSGESSNAEKWFERSNNDVQANTENLGDAEPPFFLKNSSSSETPPDAVHGGQAALSNFQQPSLPYRHGLLPAETQGSSSEDFRSVIDDLTVENKKLKRKLKKYEKLYDAHLQQEKLFEIRVHGLPAQKKRELEDTLRKFAMSLEQSPPTASMTSGYTTSTPALGQHPTTSSHTSTRFADSAYVSNSASGQHSLAPSAGDRGTRKLSKHATSRNQDIQTYLHDIPTTLLPKQSVAMTEKAKRKLVVRRLEQIFAGKGAAVTGHQQPLQQQEVSQSAAHADRMAIEATGQQAKAEGLREARIMPDAEETPKTLPLADLTKLVNANKVTGKDSPEQRPTRPLDLDLHRAQVPQDNLEYIRHLGFSPADFHIDQDEEHGWIYLNVLTNMAQLHTLNVTTEFVRKSIEFHSRKIQLSRDGRKARWKGGDEVTRTSSDGSPATGSHSPNSKGLDKNFAKKRPYTSSATSSSSPTKASRTDSGNKLAYVPLFFHKPDSDEEDLTSDEHITSWGSPHEQIGGNSSGLTSSGIRTTSSKRKRGEDGPIIFYNKAKFCTDLSGDHDERDTNPHPPVRYTTVVSDPVGTSISAPSSDASGYYGKGPLGQDVVMSDAMDLDQVSVPASEDGIGFSPKTASVTAAHTASSPLQSMQFEVSGLGGVQPSDHFKIVVQSRRKSNVGQSTPNASHYSRNKVYPQRLLQILGEQKAREQGQQGSLGSPAIEEELVSTSHEDLPTSVLPEPATLFTFSSHGDDSDESMDDSGPDSGISDFEDDADRPAPSTAPQRMNLSSHPSDGEDETDEDEDEDDYSDDGSLDFLAGARAVNPQAVHEKEREYDANMAERLAEDIPAGSSAATAGGGSGFNSPASPHVGADGKSADRRPSSSGKMSNLRRPRTADSGPTSATKNNVQHMKGDAVTTG